MTNRFLNYLRWPLLAIVLLSGNHLYAQQFGARIGSSFSYYTNDFRFESGSPALVVGGIVNYPLSDNLQLTGGLDYHQIKGSIQNTPTSVNVGSTSFVRSKNSAITIHAIEASALAGYKLPLSFLGAATPYIVGGFSIGYNAGMWDHYTIKYSSSDGTTTFRGKENVESLGTSNWLPAWNIGLRFQTPLDGGLFSSMVLDFRMRSSINTAVRPYTLNGSSAELGTKSLSATVGFTF
jgi:hypothetical protein